MEELCRDEARRRIHGAGLRATAPRVAVLRLLTATDRPLSHTEVVRKLGSDDWNQATIFRNLIRLVEVDLACVVSTIGGVARYEARGNRENLHLHPHFSCLSCGSIQCLPEVKLTGPMSSRWNRSLEASELQVVGECPDCLDARTADGTSRTDERTNWYE